MNFDAMECKMETDALMRAAERTAIGNFSLKKVDDFSELDDLLFPEDQGSQDGGVHQELMTATPSPTVMPSVHKLVPTAYTFPATMTDVEYSSIGTLKERMLDLVASYREHGNYLRIREEYCCLAIALNREGLWSPAFRPAPVIPYRKNLRQPQHLTLYRDLLVIDCHWLRCRGEDVAPRDIEYLELFDASIPFSFDLAASFACRNWSASHRADEALFLTTWQQTQMAKMQGTVLRGRREAALDGSRLIGGRISPKIAAVKRAMREWCRKDRRVTPHRQVFEDLWLARELLGQDSSMRDIAQLGAMIVGVPPLAEKTVREKLNRLDKRMAG